MVRADHPEWVWINRISDRHTWMVTHEEYAEHWPDAENGEQLEMAV